MQSPESRVDWGTGQMARSFYDLIHPFSSPGSSQTWPGLFFFLQLAGTALEAVNAHNLVCYYRHIHERLWGKVQLTLKSVSLLREMAIICLGVGLLRLGRTASREFATACLEKMCYISSNPVLAFMGST